MKVFFSARILVSKLFIYIILLNILIYFLVLLKIYIAVGSVAHLGERLHGMEEVEGSIPFRSTRK